MLGNITAILGDNHVWHTFSMSKLILNTQSQYHEIKIFDNEIFDRMLLIDNVIQSSRRDEYIYHESVTQIPIVAHGDVKTVLLIGGGGGGCLREIVKHPYIKTIDVVELDQKVVDACKKHMPFLSKGAFDDGRVRLTIDNALNVIPWKKKYYDVIIMDTTDPQVGSSSELYTPEFFKDCKNALKDGGIFATHASSTLYDYKLMVNMKDNILGPLFDNFGFYFHNIPSLGGMMTFAWASDDMRIDELTHFNFDGLGLKYLYPEMIPFSFKFPPWING